MGETVAGMVAAVLERFGADRYAVDMPVAGGREREE